MSAIARGRRAIEPAPPARRRHWMVWLVGLGLLVVIGANAHLVYVALTSQPDCVHHLKLPDGGAQFRAAKSSC